MHRKQWVLGVLAASVMTASTLVAGPLPAQAATATPLPPTINGVVYVANAAELEYIDQNFSHYAAASIALTANINLQGYAWQPWNGFTGNGFTGTLNGNGYTIENLSVSTTDSDSGLIGNLNGGTVENLGLVNPTVSATGPSRGGGLVGNAGASSHLTNVYVQGGSVTGQHLGYPTGLGGLVGYLASGTVTNAYSTAAVSSTTVTGGTAIGGFIGFSAGTVTGGVWDAAAATATGPSAVGTGPITGIVSDTATQMQTPSDQATAYPGWNFTTVWTQSAGQFPTLRATPPAVPSLTVTASPGSTVGSETLSATPNTAGDTFAVQVSSAAPAPVALGATPPSGATAYTVGSSIPNVAPGDIVTLYEVSPSGAVVAAGSVTANVTAAAPTKTTLAVISDSRSSLPIRDRLSA
jgi:hypothetical protein